ncbi:MAG: Hint domain-containing protein, partial [Pseudodonghicola sp.]
QEATGDPAYNADTSVIYGTYGSSSNWLASSLVSLTSYNDANATDGNMVDADDGSPTDNGDPNAGTGDGFRYDLNGDGVNDYDGQMDYMDQVQVDILYVDGTTQTAYMWVVQMQNGDTFLLPNNPTETDPLYNTAKLDQVAVESVTLSASPGTLSDTEGYSMSQTYHLATGIVCFASGTLIATDIGLRSIETLQIGDLVETHDSGYQPIRWIGGRHLTSAMLAANPNLRPVRIRAGALGLGLPTQDLVVSPQHRVLVRSVVAERMFGEAEVLVAAKQLQALDGIEVAEDLTEVTYWHFLFDAHQVVFSNGAMTESLFTGPEALRAVCPEARQEILEIFPDLDATPDAGTDAVRLLVSGRLARKLAERTARNGKLLVA